MSHLDEGTIHAWLDGQLPQDEAAAAEAHVAECRQCAGAVAEARGLIAASSRILMSLDSVPRDVAPKSATPAVPAVQPPIAATAASRSAEPNDAVDVVDLRSRSASASRPSRPARRWLSGPSLAAAATIVVAIGTFTLTRLRGGDAVVSTPTVAESARLSGPVADSATSIVASAPMPAPVAASAGVGRANEAAVPAAPPAARSLASGVRAQEADQVADRAASPRREGFSNAPANAVAQLPQEAKRAKLAEPVSAKDELARLGKERVTVLTDSAALRRQVAAAPPAPVVPQAKPDTTTVRVFRGNSVAKSVEDRRDLSAASARVGHVRGRVTDGNGTGLAGAMATIVGTSIGVATDSTGQFMLAAVPTGSRRLTIRRLGFEPVTSEIDVVAGQTATADIVLKPAVMALQQVVVTGTGATAERRSAGNAIARSPAAASPEAPPGAAVTAQQSNAIGCYEMGITPTAVQPRSNFRQTPRRVSLDAEIVPSNADGIWYRARDLARTGAVRDGLWRPVGTDGLELEWTYGTFTARIRLTGPATAMMRGTAEEIDRANGTGESGSVVSIKGACPR